MYPPTRGTCHSHFPESPLSCERVLGRCFGAGFFRVIRTGCLRTTAPITARPPAVARAPRVVGFPGVSVLTTWLPVSSTSAAAPAPRAPDPRGTRLSACASGDQTMNMVRTSSSMLLVVVLEILGTRRNRTKRIRDFFSWSSGWRAHALRELRRCRAASPTARVSSLHLQL